MRSRPVEVDRAAEHRHADAVSSGTDSPVIDAVSRARLAGQHPTIRRHPIAGAHFHLSPGFSVPLSTSTIEPSA
jgi:hypothetical protein